MRAIAWLAGLATLLVGALYMIVSLNRWEWNRALFFGLIVLIAEVGLATALVLRRIGQLAPRRDIDPAVGDLPDVYLYPIDALSQIVADLST